MATTQGCINVMTKALISANFTLRPHNISNDAQRDEHARKMNTVAEIDAPVSFYSWIGNRYSWISIHGSLT